MRTLVLHLLLEVVDTPIFTEAQDWEDEKMSVQVVKIMMVVLATVTFGMAGCGGGGGASTPAVVNTNTYSTAKENIRLYQVRKTYLPKLFLN